MEKFDICFHFTEYNIFYDITNDLYEMLQEESKPDEIDLFRKIILAYSSEIAILLNEVGYSNIVEEKMFWSKLKEICSINKYISNEEIQIKNLDDLYKIYERDIFERLNIKL